MVEIIDHNDKVEAFLEVANKLIEEAGCGALITVEKAEVIYYKSRKQ